MPFFGELDPRLNEFLKHLIKRREISFTPSEMVATLVLNISPTKFGKLLNNNLQLLEREGVYIEKNKTASARNYRVVFIDPRLIKILMTLNSVLVIASTEFVSYKFKLWETQSPKT